MPSPFNRSPARVLDLLEEARSYLRDDEAGVADEDHSFSDQELRNYGQASIDMRAAEMGLTGEHQTTQSHFIDVVAGVRAYPLPSMVTAPDVVWLRFEDGANAREIPLRRDDKNGDSYVANRGAWPTIRLQGNLMLIEPPSDENRDRGIRLEAKFLPPRLLRATDTDDALAAEVIDPIFPDVYERLFVFDIVELARGTEDNQGLIEPGQTSRLDRFHRQYERTFRQVIQKRLTNRTFTRPYIVG